MSNNVYDMSSSYTYLYTIFVKFSEKTKQFFGNLINREENHMFKMTVQVFLFDECLHCLSRI